MKYVPTLFFLLLCSIAQAQKSFTFHGRPTQMGYCLDENGEINCFAGIDLTGYLIHINYVENAETKIILFHNGALVEESVFAPVSELKITKKQFSFIASSFTLKKNLHLPLFTSGDHKVELIIYTKNKKGIVRFYYPEENNKAYTYFFDLL